MSPPPMPPTQRRSSDDARDRGTHLCKCPSGDREVGLLIFTGNHLARHAGWRLSPRDARGRGMFGLRVRVS